MKIKYIGNFNDGTGWAKASTYNALALDAAGYDVHCEEHKYNDYSVVLEPKITELLEKKSDSYDVVIQHVLPINYKYIGGVKNIGFVALENVKFTNQVWLKNLKMMDDIFVPNLASQKVLSDNGIESKVFNHSFNFDKVANLNSKVEITELNNTFNFVFVGEFITRKNLEALLIAFHNEFSYFESVNLYIKTAGKPLQQITSFCDEVKRGMKKTTRYKKEIIISEYMEESSLLSTVKQCHAFVMPSRGEAWCYPAMEAMALGIPCIYTNGIGVEDYCKSGECGISVESYFSPCYKANDTFQDLYTSKDVWLEINILGLQNAMRAMYNAAAMNPKEYQTIRKNCIDKAKEYDYNNSKIVEGLL